MEVVIGANANLFLGLSSAAQGGASFLGANGEASAQRLQGQYQKQQADTNARLADMQAADAVNRGEREAQMIGRKTKEVIGADRASFGAQGVDVNSGSALDVQADAAQHGAEDQLTTRNNAWREAWGFRVEAENYRSQGAYAAMAGENAARTTILTGGLKAIGYGLSGAGYFGRWGAGLGGGGGSGGGTPRESLGAY